MLSQLAQNNKDDELQELRGLDSETAAYEMLAAAIPAWDLYSTRHMFTFKFTIVYV